MERERADLVAVGVDARDYAPIPFAVIDAWIRTIPGMETRLQTAIREARQFIHDLDSLERPGVNSMFYAHGYNKLHLALEELLDAVGSPGA